MNIPTCATLIHDLGWHCAPVEAQGSHALYVSTSVLLPNGTPLDFYLISYGDHIIVTDDGLWLFALRSLGYALDDRRNWRGLSDVAEKHGFALRDDGTFEYSVAASDLGMAGGRILQMICSIASWELEHYASSDSDLSLNREVEQLMRRKAPTWEVEKSPIVRLSNGDELRFDFRWGEKLVDAIAPIALSVSARLRKILQMQREAFDTDRMLFIIDDRAAPEKATHELALLSQMAKAVRFTDFEERFEASTESS